MKLNREGDLTKGVLGGTDLPIIMRMYGEFDAYTKGER